MELGERIKNAVEKSLELVKRSNIAMVGTIGEDGFPNIKAMLSDVNNGLREIWFSTNTSSIKVAHVRANPRVNAYYCHPKIFHGLMLSGDMQIVDDVKLRHSLWEEGWERYYSAGMDDPDYTVLRLEPNFAQGWYKGNHFKFEL